MEELHYTFMRRLYGDYEIAQKNSVCHRFEERFEARLDIQTIVLPNKPTIKSFSWIVDSIGHEYLHFIVAELEGFDAGARLDRLGYCDATGYNLRPLEWNKGFDSEYYRLGCTEL